MRTAVIVIASIALLLFALWEVGMAFPVAWWLYLPLAILFALALVRHAPLRGQLARLSTLGILCGIISALYFVDWTSRKPFLRDLCSIQPGMSESEVRQIMARYTEGTGRPAAYGAPSNAPGTLHDVGTGASYATGSSPSGHLIINDSLVFRHSTSGRFDSDWGVVTLSNSRVVHVSFSPD